MDSEERFEIVVGSVSSPRDVALPIFGWPHSPNGAVVDGYDGLTAFCS